LALTFGVCVSTWIVSQTLSWSITDGNSEGSFAIDSSTGDITVTATGVNYEGTNSFTLTIQVEDDGTPAKTDTTTVSITIDDVNDVPVLSDQTRYVNESLAAPGSSIVGTLVGAVLGGTDEDATPVQTLTYTIDSGNTNSVFSIDNDGQIRVAKAELDFETTPTCVGGMPCAWVRVWAWVWVWVWVWVCGHWVRVCDVAWGACSVPPCGVAGCGLGD